MVRVCVGVKPVSADALDVVSEEVGQELVSRCGEHAKGAVQWLFHAQLREHARRDPVRRGPYRHLARAVHRIRIAPPRFGASDTGSDTAARSEAQQRPRQLALRSRTTWRLFPVERQSGRPKVFQYTAINDYTRNEVFRLYTLKTRGPAIRFYTTFPIPKLQADNDTEFPLLFAFTG
ncbi:MAG TPA: hypothetical protein VFT30_09220 [Nitrospira sp.]|nr:hypothetical protein [Nitrospira sp.]